MPRTAPSTRPSAFVQAVAGLAVVAAAVGTLLWGRAPVSAFVAVVALVAYIELRRALHPSGLRHTMAVGALGVLGWLWFGYDGHLERLPWVGAGLVLALLAVWVVFHEITGRAEGATTDIAATVVAAGIVGVFGAHLLLIRAIPFGFRGLLAFALMVLGANAAALVAGHVLERTRRVELTGASFGASLLIGVVVGSTMDPPFDLTSGAAFGAGMGILVPLGQSVFTALRRTAEERRSGNGRASGVLVGGGLDMVFTVLFSAPAFYWALRTIAL